MNFIKRGITSIIRKPGKTIILLLIVFILGNIICGAISIQQAVNNTDKNLKAKMTTVATLEYDYESMSDAELENIKPVPVNTIKEIGGLSYVKNYDYSTNFYFNSKSIEPYFSDEDMRYSGYSFGCIGGQNPEILDIKENVIKLTAGRTFSDDEINNLTYVAVISQSLADANNLTTGSKFTLDNIIYNEDYTGGEDAYDEEYISAMQSYEFEVIGIFDLVKSLNETSEKAAVFNLDDEILNKIYVTNKVIEAAYKFSESEYAKMHEDYPTTEEVWYEPLYVLNDPSELDAFKEQADKLLPEFYYITNVSDSYETVAKPMETIQQISKIVLYVAVGASLIILSLLITLFLRDRKHEIGIYLSLGEKKIKVVTQVVLEVVIVAAIAIAVSLFSGSILAGKVSDTMLNNEIIAQQEESDGSYSMNQIEMRGYGNDISTDDLTETYSVSLDGTTILLFFAVGLGTVIISTLVPIIYITRLNPKKIMM